MSRRTSTTSRDCSRSLLTTDQPHSALLLSSEKQLVDLVAVAAFTKQAVEMIDGAQVLLDQGAVNPSKLQLRALFEVSVYFDWLLADDRDARATAYYAWNLRRKRTWILRAIPGTPEHAAMQRDLAGIGPLKSVETEHVREEAKRQLVEIDELLSGPDYADVNAAFDEKRGARHHDPPWYVVRLRRKQRPTLWTLAQDVGRGAEYRVIYDLGSEAMHSSQSDVHIRVLEGSVRLRPLRDLSDFGLIAHLIIGQAIRIYGKLLDRYRPTERENFAHKYVAEWRSGFLKQRSVTYEYHDVSITV
jgi:hypothetical protein